MSQALVTQQSTALALADQMSMAEAFVKSGLFSDVKDSAQALVKIVKGQEMGLQPMASMQAFDIIKGQIFVSGKACAALVNTCPYAEYRLLDSTPEACTVAFAKRTREGWVDLEAVTYTFAMAKARGLTERSPEWKTDPENMLFWRCMTRGVRRYFSELTMGLSVSIAQEPVDDSAAKANIADLFGDDRRDVIEVSGELVDTTTGEVHKRPPTPGTRPDLERVAWRESHGISKALFGDWAAAECGLLSWRDITPLQWADIDKRLRDDTPGALESIGAFAMALEGPQAVDVGQTADDDAQEAML